MKIQCHVCEVAVAKVLCCADEAALCLACDERVHAANKLASKHQRVSLSDSSSQMPKCDFCQETVGHFFCLEDRALLCRKCDIAIHSANDFVSSHQRFLLTGVRLSLEAAEPGSSSLSCKSLSGEKILEPDISLVLKRSASLSTDSRYNKQLPMQVTGIGELLPARITLTGGSGAGSIPQWQFDEFLGLNDGNQYLTNMENGSSKADGGKLGDSDRSAFLGTGEEGLDDDYLGQMPDASWAVPEIPSPPTASGLYCPKGDQDPTDSRVFVPDISSSGMRNLYEYQTQGPRLKRRRQF